MRNLFLDCVRKFASASKMGLPRVFFDMKADGQSLGRIIMEVSVKLSWKSGYRIVESRKKIEHVAKISTRRGGHYSANKTAVMSYRVACGHECLNAGAKPAIEPPVSCWRSIEREADAAVSRLCGGKLPGTLAPPSSYCTRHFDPIERDAVIGLGVGWTKTRR